MGLMLESANDVLCEKGGPHGKSPGKRPALRLEVLRHAGRLRIPFTTGILVGIGESPKDRIEASLAIRDVHIRYGHNIRQIDF